MRIFALSVLLFVFNVSIAQKPAKGVSPSSNPKSEVSHTIKVRVQGVKDTAVYLANYYGNKLFYNDTARADAKGNVEFKGKPFNEGGKYAIVVPGPKFFEFLVDDKNIRLETDVNDFVGSMKVIESDNNKVFFDYIKFINDKRLERTPLDTALARGGLSPKEEESIKKQMQGLNDQVTARQNEIVKTQGDQLIGKLIKMTLDIEVPEIPEGVNDPNYRYNYFISHFWDNTDLSDPRLVRDQQMHRKLEQFITQALVQIPDSIIKAQDNFLNMTKGNYELTKYAIHFFTYTAEKSQIMCMDKVFVHMVDRYYKTGVVDWIKDDQMTKIIDSAEDKRYTLCGNKAVNIILPDTTDKKWVNLYEIKADYTIIAVWESSCGHCKKEMPKLHEFYKKWKSKGVEVLAIGNDFENKEWKETIRQNNYDWINVSDNPQINKADSARTLIMNGTTTLQSLNFRKTYDIFSTPKIFVLDKDKKIIAKQLNTDQIEELIMRLSGEGSATEPKKPATGVSDQKKKKS